MVRSRHNPPHAIDEAPRGGVITAFEPQGHDPERISIFLDGAFAFGLKRLVAAEHGLAIGDELTAERVVSLRALDEQGKAVEAALRLIVRRPRSEREVRDRLKRKGYEPEVIDVVVARLAEHRFVDDESFARYWVENREANRPRGRRLLEQELRVKGVDRETIRETIDEAELDEPTAAFDLATAKLRSYANLEPLVARRRLAAYLVRRGYGYEAIKPALDRLFGEADEESAESTP